MDKNRTHRELFEHARDHAAKMFLEGGDYELVPMWHAVCKEGPDLIIATPWGDEEQKEGCVMALRELFAVKGVQFYVFMTEAWVVEGLDLEQLRKAGAPSQHEDRREVIHITSEGQDGKTYTGRYYILRPEHGPPTLSPFKEDPFDLMGGRMTRMLVRTGR